MKWINPYLEPRERMVRDQLVGRGLHDRRVLDAMLHVPREAFVPEECRHVAYSDEPLPIGEGQTISQPYIVAAMIEALGLKGNEHILEVGTGSGYGAAVLAHVARAVHSIERIPSLAKGARETLKRLGYGSVDVVEGDGTLGWVPGAPYDAIIATACGPDIPSSFRSQLKPGGRLVMPVADKDDGQLLVRMSRGLYGSDRTEGLEPVRFVPLIGAQGWSEGDARRSVIHS